MPGVGLAAQPMTAFLVRELWELWTPQGGRKMGGKKIPKTMHQPETVLGGSSGGALLHPWPPSCSLLVSGEQTAGPGGKRHSRASSHRLPGIWSAREGGRLGERGRNVS